MKQIIVLSIIFLLVALGVKAGETASVTATVTAQKVSVDVQDHTVVYGTMQLSTWKSTLDLNDMQTATNDGNVAEDFNIRGQNSANWILAETPGTEQYTHQFCNDTANDCSGPPTNYTALSASSYTTLATNVAKDGSIDFQLRLGTPTATIHFNEQSVDVTVQAVAH